MLVAFIFWWATLHGHCNPCCCHFPVKEHPAISVEMANNCLSSVGVKGKLPALFSVPTARACAVIVDSFGEIKKLVNYISRSIDRNDYLWPEFFSFSYPDASISVYDASPKVPIPLDRVRRLGGVVFVWCDSVRSKIVMDFVRRNSNSCLRMPAGDIRYLVIRFKECLELFDVAPVFLCQLKDNVFAVLGNKNASVSHKKAKPVASRLAFMRVGESAVIDKLSETGLFAGSCGNATCFNVPSHTSSWHASQACNCSDGIAIDVHAGNGFSDRFTYLTRPWHLVNPFASGPFNLTV